MHLILAEKPSVARAIATVLGSPRKSDGYVTVGDWIITWAFGHLLTLAAPNAYDPAWQKWQWATLPMFPEPFQLEPIAKGAAQLKIIGLLLHRSDVTDVICATDADREGELIFRWIYRHCVATQPVRRLWLSETTPAAIRAALKAMKPASATDALSRAAEARAQADWLVGLNATRAFTLRHGRPGQGALSVGRVQTPTLRLIADRDAAIAAFTSVPYWQVAVTFQAPEGSYVGIWTAASGEHPDRLADQGQARVLAAKVPPGTPGIIQSAERKRVAVAPPLPFSLNDLQKEAHRRLGFTAQQTLDTAQALYEKHWTSYPRTDARYLTVELAATLPDRLKGLTGAYPDLIRAIPIPIDAQRLVNDAKVAKAGHHAIIPTGQPAAGCTGKEGPLYDLIARRFLASLLPAGEDERTTVITVAANERFVTQGTVILVPGWRMALKPIAEPDAEEDAEPTPAIPAGLRSRESVTVTEASLHQKHTKAPPALNDASLLALMEKHGLGTPATRARIVEVLCLRGYVARKKKALVSTDKGRALLTVVPDAIQSPDLTGQWEARLEAIAAGKEQTPAFLADIRAYAREVVDAARQQASQTIESDLGPCPSCHQGHIIAGRKAWGCSRWKDGCKFTIWKTLAGKTITEAQVKTLLAGKTTGQLKGFTSKAGKAFSAKLKLDGDKVTFVFGSSANRAGKGNQQGA